MTDRPADSESGDRFEDRLARLEALLAELERGDLPLEEALRKHEAGIAELRRCYEMLDTADARVQKLIERADGTPGTEDM